jgi:hypothetical protein
MRLHAFVPLNIFHECFKYTWTGDGILHVLQIKKISDTIIHSSLVSIELLFAEKTHATSPRYPYSVKSIKEISPLRPASYAQFTKKV